jgi:hypothetical protein
MNISQSLIKDAWPQDVCPKYIEFKYVLCVEGKRTPAMFRGLYFEWHLLGAVRDGVEPVYPDNKTTSTKELSDGSKIKDKRPKEQLELDILVAQARAVLLAMGLNPDKGEKQVFLEKDGLSGTIDWRTGDIVKREREALYDVKYTESKYDDRWNGWADFDTMPEQKLQAVHYIILDQKATGGEYKPFYFLVFGKGGWVRVIKVELSSDGIAHHELRVHETKAKLKEWRKAKFKAKPSFNKCIECPYREVCPDRSLVPEIEVFQV